MQLILSKNKWQHRCTIGVENKIGYIDENYFKKSSGELQDVLTVTNSMGSLNLIKLAIPMFFEVIFNFLIGTVSTIVLSGYSDDAAAATGMASIVMNLFSILFTGIAGGCSVLVSN